MSASGMGIPVFHFPNGNPVGMKKDIVQFENGNKKTILTDLYTSFKTEQRTVLFKPSHCAFQVVVL